jgi:uncharacterized membrane protein
VEKANLQGGLGTGRVEALADGVFAVAMTLLILDLRLPPEAHARTQPEVLSALRSLWPQAVCYGMSFITIGTLWVAHRTSFHYIRRSDRPLLWINILLLIFVSTIPFMTSLVSQYPRYPIPIGMYGVNLLCAVAMLYWNWKHATGRRHLASPELSERTIQAVSRRICIGPIFYLLGIAAALYKPWVSIVLYALVPVSYAFPGSVDRHWWYAASPEEVKHDELGNVNS